MNHTSADHDVQLTHGAESGTTHPDHDATDTLGGRVVRVSGPVIEVTDLDDPHIYDVVRVGPRHLPGEVIREREGFAAHDRWHGRPPFADPIFRERWAILQRNSDAFIARHGYERDGGRYRVVRSNRETLAIFCHGGFGLTWLAHLLHLPVPLVWSGFWLPPSSVTTILFDERSSHWAVPRCIGLGDIGHLYEAGLAVQAAGIQANFD